MKTITSREVQKNFGTVSDLLKAGESIRVTHYGRPAFVMLPETAETEEILRRFAGKRLMHILADAQPNEQASALTQDQINQMIHESFT
jgi:antitoxin (DNA-binding transcriptional repressor) of toxin-antitoxin stability system